MGATTSLLPRDLRKRASFFGYPRERVFRQAARVRCGSNWDLDVPEREVRCAPYQRTSSACWDKSETEVISSLRVLFLRKPSVERKTRHLAALRTRNAYSLGGNCLDRRLAIFLGTVTQ